MALVAGQPINVFELMETLNELVGSIGPGGSGSGGGSTAELFMQNGQYVCKTDEIYVTACGAGGGKGGSDEKDGGSSQPSTGRAGGGAGGGGAVIVRKKFSVTPGQILNINIGVPGTNGTNGYAYHGDGSGAPPTTIATDGTAGSSTIVGPLVTLPGGSGGKCGISQYLGYGATGCKGGAGGAGGTPGAGGGAGGVGYVGGSVSSSTNGPGAGGAGGGPSDSILAGKAGTAGGMGGASVISEPINAGGASLGQIFGGSAIAFGNGASESNSSVYGFGMPGICIIEEVGGDDTTYQNILSKITEVLDAIADCSGGSGGSFTNQQVFTSTQNFFVPAGVTKVRLTGCGAGGGNGYSWSYEDSDGYYKYHIGGSGGGGACCFDYEVNVTPNSTILVTIGNAGSNGTSGSGANGGTTSFGSLLTLPGGQGGQAYYGKGGDGGSPNGGGGGGGYYTERHLSWPSSTPSNYGSTNGAGGAGGAAGLGGTGGQPGSAGILNNGTGGTGQGGASPYSPAVNSMGASLGSNYHNTGVNYGKGGGGPGILIVKW